MCNDDDVIADKCFGMNYETCRPIFNQMLQNPLDGASQCRWTVKKAIPDLLRQRRIFSNGRGQSLTEGKMPMNKQEMKTAEVKTWQVLETWRKPRM